MPRGVTSLEPLTDYIRTLLSATNRLFFFALGLLYTIFNARGIAVHFNRITVDIEVFLNKQQF
ncbi:hypothetical protein AG1IA_00601 [Rhizoctonia solani AG-1 IA]|uniref:Uncharacterized protein n=1 Tax=Thanatephorus cucumeris (strain AG1-IA) TaxID=983506 RepID=L8X8F3_THACA|nr:hypothetical protein AG1IA_00601 [Rhizoctonia solani AG-1 IA]